MVEIHKVQDSIVLRKSGSELLILPVHVLELKKRQTAKDFAEYFLNDALVNRPARKLYENWLRKDGDLWRNLFKTVQSMEISNESEETSTPEKKQPSRPVQETVVAQTRSSLKETQVAVTSSSPSKAKVPKDVETPKKSISTASAQSSPTKSAPKPTLDTKSSTKEAQSSATSKSGKTSSDSKSSVSASSKKDTAPVKKKEVVETKSAAKKPAATASPAKSSATKSTATKSSASKSTVSKSAASKSSTNSKSTGAKKSNKK